MNNEMVIHAGGMQMSAVAAQWVVAFGAAESGGLGPMADLVPPLGAAQFRQELRLGQQLKEWNWIKSSIGFVGFATGTGWLRFGRSGAVQRWWKRHRWSRARGCDHRAGARCRGCKEPDRSGAPTPTLALAHRRRRAAATAAARTSCLVTSRWNEPHPRGTPPLLHLPSIFIMVPLLRQYFSSSNRHSLIGVIN